MQPETLFSIVTPAMLPAWLLLIFLPGWRWTARLIRVIVPAVLGALYLILVWRYFGPSGGGYGTPPDAADRG